MQPMLNEEGEFENTEESKQKGKEKEHIIINFCFDSERLRKWGVCFPTPEVSKRYGSLVCRENYRWKNKNKSTGYFESINTYFPRTTFLDSDETQDHGEFQNRIFARKQYFPPIYGKGEC